MGFDTGRAALGMGMQPNGSGRARKTEDQAVTVCKICDESIFMSESRVWALRVEPSRASGLVHCSCAESTGTETVGKPATGGQRKYRT